MTRAVRLVAVAAVVVAAAGLSACGWSSDMAVAPVTASPLVTVDPSTTAPPALPAAGAPGGPVRILDGLLTTATDEHVISDSAADYASRGAEGWQAATRAQTNPISHYRKQLVAKGFTLTVDEPARLAGEREGDWIAVTTTNVQSLTGTLPWATVLAIAHLAPEPTVR